MPQTYAPFTPEQLAEKKELQRQLTKSLIKFAAIKAGVYLGIYLLGRAARKYVAEHEND